MTDLNLSVITVHKLNPYEGILDIVEMDCDYEDYSDEITSNIMNKGGSVEDMIKRALGGEFGDVIEIDDDGDEVNVLGDVSTFILENDTYTSQVQYEITEVGDVYIVSVGYTIHS